MIFTQGLIGYAVNFLYAESVLNITENQSTGGISEKLQI